MSTLRTTSRFVPLLLLTGLLVAGGAAQISPAVAQSMAQYSIQELPPAPGLSGGSNAVGLSPNGRAAGTQTLPSGVTRAHRWTNGVPTDLNGSAPKSGAFDVNTAGVTVG